MAEWGVPFDHIANNWTDEQLDLMIEKLTERKQREKQAMRGTHGDPGGHKVPDSVLFARARNMIKVVKRGD